MTEPGRSPAPGASSPTSGATLARPGSPVDYVCRTCGGRCVTRDAWADWDLKAQRWKLGAAFDFAFCHDCEEETRLAEVALEARGPAGSGF